jgi:CDP-diacylglycerol--glycerol-3-phosphate 3-phosphatidyltransferase
VGDFVDIVCSFILVGALAIALGSHAVASAAAGRLLVAKRVDREQGLPVVGRTPMHAVYRSLLPLGRALVAAHVSANAVTVMSLALAVLAAVAFAFGHLGVGAAIACVATLADAVDGMVARESGTQSRLGQILDTSVDRYVDALLLGGLAVYVRHDAALLIIVLGAIVGSFMVSYASSIERELGHTSPAALVPMRRAHRLAYVLTGAALGPFAALAVGEQRPAAGLVPVLVAVAAIATVGNVSAVRRLAAVARATNAPVASPPDSSPRQIGEGEPAATPQSVGARR